MRLEKYLSDCGYGSRKEIKRLIEMGKVRVNSENIKNGSISINENKDRVEVSDRTVMYKKYYYYIMNKPSGYITAKADKSEKTVMDILPEWVNKKDLSPVGRLDKDTEGLLLFTNDGDSAHNMMSPKNHIKKVYYCKLIRIISLEEADRLCGGVKIEGGYTTREAEVEIIGPFEIKLTITEGKYHQVKQMLEAIGNRVIYLKRIKFGKFEIGNMDSGEIKEIGLEEII